MRVGTGILVCMRLRLFENRRKVNKLGIRSRIPEGVPIRTAMNAKRSARNPWALLVMLCGGIAWGQDPLSEAVTQNNEAVRCMDEGRYADAEHLFRAALAGGYDDDLTRAKIANNLATLYQRLDRFPDSERMFRRALQWRQKNLPAASVEIAYSLNNLGEIYRIQGRDWEARNLLETSVRSLQRFHPDAAGLPLVLSNLAIVRCRFSEFDPAEELLRAALLFYSKREGAGSREYGVALNNLGQVQETKKDWAGAAASYAQAIGIFEQVGASARVDLATALANAGELYQRQDRMEEAGRAEHRAWELLNASGDATLRAVILRNLGNIVAKTGNVADSLPYFEKSLDLQEKTFGGEHPSTAGLLLDYAAATQRAGNKSLSRKLRKRASDLLARLAGQSPDQLTVSVNSLREIR
jgi:tetratricopeptide (TPR) repeat protein